MPLQYAWWVPATALCPIRQAFGPRMCMAMAWHGVVVFQSELQLISDRVRVGKPCDCLPLLTGHSRIMLGWWFATRHHRAITGVMMSMDQSHRF
jgi:hypothetical protein